MLLVKGVGAIFDPATLLGEQLQPVVTLEDLGLRTRSPGDDTVVESRAGFITDSLAERIAEIANLDRRSATPVLTYVANSIRIGDRSIPYSTVTAVDLPASNIADGTEKWTRPLFLNEWAAEDLGAKVGDTVTLDYFLWSDEDGLDTASSEFTLRRRGADGRHRRRSDADAGIPRNQRRRGHDVVGPALPGRSQARAAEGRGLLGSLSCRAESDHFDRRRPAHMGVALRQSVVVAALGQRAVERAGHRSGRRGFERPSRPPGGGRRGAGHD